MGRGRSILRFRVGCLLAQLALIVTPVGPSGVAFLGDGDRFVSNGQNRVVRLRDSGTLRAEFRVQEKRGSVGGQLEFGRHGHERVAHLPQR